MILSLILCTIGRDKEVERFLESIVVPVNTKVQLIIVDQNSDNRVLNIISSFKNESVKVDYYKVNFKGLSRARNFALQFVKGEYVGFPDDDCVYASSVITEVLSAFQDHRYNTVLISPCFDVYGATFASSYRIFFTYEAIKNQLFDELVGVGSSTIFGASEEIMFQAEVQNKEQTIISSTYVEHPTSDITKFNHSKLKDYSIGNGALMYKQFGLMSSIKKCSKEFILKTLERSSKGCLVAFYKFCGVFCYFLFKLFFKR